MNQTLLKYIYGFSRLKRGGTKYGLAPHKPVLLITLIDLFEKGVITSNQIYVNVDLVGSFKENWGILVDTAHQPDFTQPFYYLQNDRVKDLPFWFLKAKPGLSINAHIKSVHILADVCQYAYLLEDLFLLLGDDQIRMLLTKELLNVYFPDKIQSFLNKKLGGVGYLYEIEKFILNEARPALVPVISEYEEDLFVRGGLFKKLIPKLYHRSCSFTGMKLESTFAYNFVDACHIIPFSINQDDRVTNGIALCPNLHRAFDRGLISISENYRILVSDHIIEDNNHAYSLKRLEGIEMILPAEKHHYPSTANLEWHRQHVFKKVIERI